MSITSTSSAPHLKGIMHPRQLDEPATVDADHRAGRLGDQRPCLLRQFPRPPSKLGRSEHWRVMAVVLLFNSTNAIADGYRPDVFLPQVAPTGIRPKPKRPRPSGSLRLARMLLACLNAMMSSPLHLK